MRTHFVPIKVSPLAAFLYLWDNTRGMTGRWLRFFLMIVIGIGLGLLYAWVVDPVELVDTQPDTLREDYRADYVLMVAEAYQADKDLPLAVRRLGLLGANPPAQIVLQALQFAEGGQGSKARYVEADLLLLRRLFDALQPLGGLMTPAP